MKKMLCIFFLVLLVLSGCSGNRTNPNVPEGTTLESQRDYQRFMATIIVDDKTKKRFIIVDYGNGVDIEEIGK